MASDKLCPKCKVEFGLSRHTYCKKCDLDYKRAWYKANRPYSSPYKPFTKDAGQVGFKRDHPLYRAFSSSKRRAKKHGIEFSLVLAELVVPSHCPVLGIPLDSSTQQNIPSLDQIKPRGGYTKDNVRVISYRANMIKSNATAEELLKVYQYVATA